MSCSICSSVFLLALLQLAISCGWFAREWDVRIDGVSHVGRRLHLLPVHLPPVAVDNDTTITSACAGVPLKPTETVHVKSEVLLSAFERCAPCLNRDRVARYIAMRTMSTPTQSWSRHVSWRRSHTDVVAAVVGGIKQPIRCAAVGNSPSLLRAERGDEIDAHQIVLRFNFAPTLGHERHVGSATHLRMMAQVYVPGNRTEGSVIIHRHMDRDVARQDAAANGHYSVVAMNGWSMFHIGSKRRSWYPSSGIAGVVMLLRVCAHVSLYGFDTRDVHPGHYFDEEKEGLLVNLRQLLLREPWRTRLAPNSLFTPGGVLRAVAYVPQRDVASGASDVASGAPVTQARRSTMGAFRRGRQKTMYIVSHDNDLIAPGALNHFIRSNYAAMNHSIKAHNMQLERAVLRAWIDAGCVKNIS